MKNQILIIGSAHLDILADYTEQTKNFIDKIGSLKIAIGGSAYNIAVNLANNNYKVSILTVLKTNSLSAKLICESLEEKGISTDFITNYDFIPESGFVAHRLSGRLESAVSSTVIDQVSLDSAKTSQAIRNSALVILDCNLSKQQISEIVRECDTQNKPIMVCSVSESKVDRALKLANKLAQSFLLFSLNSVEAKKFYAWEAIDDINGIIDLCKFFSAQYVVITNGKKGYSVFENTGNRKDFGAPIVPIVKSELGAGDALLSGLAASYIDDQLTDWERASDTVDRFILPVLSVEEGTLGASKASDLTHFGNNNFISPFFGRPKDIKQKFDAFILMPFTDPFHTIFNDHIKPTLATVNYTAGTAGNIFGNSSIMGDIWASICHAKVLVADCTGRNPNVFYEIGISHTLGKNVILITQDLKDIPFDLRHIRIIQYDYTPSGVKRLERELLNVIEAIGLINF